MRYNVKNPVYKKWCFWVAIAITISVISLVITLISSNSVDATDDTGAFQQYVFEDRINNIEKQIASLESKIDELLESSNDNATSHANIMPVRTSALNKNGLEITPDGNGGYILNGTATATTVYKIYESTTALPDGFTAGCEYRLAITEGYVGTVSVMSYDGSSWRSAGSIINSTEATFVVPDDTVGLQIKFYPATNDYTYANETVVIECSLITSDISQGETTQPKPMLTIIDDDGYKKFMTLLLPIIQAKGIPIATAIPVAYVNGESEEHGDKVMNWDDIEICYLAGAEVLSHTYCHLSQAKAETMTKEQIQQDYQRAQNALRTHGIKSEGLVFAGGSVDVPNCQDACKNVYNYGFKAYGNKINFKGNINPYRIERYKIEPDGLLNETNLKALVDTLISEGTGWMVWMIHTSDGNFQQEQADIIGAVIDYAIEHGIDIVTTETAVRYYQ